MQTIQGRVLIGGAAQGVAFKLEKTLSFWGGFNPVNGEIIDVHHPQYTQRVGDSILFIPQSHGSAGTPGGIAETLRNGSGPKAFILGRRDINISVGAWVANRLYDMNIPVIEITLTEMDLIKTGNKVAVDQAGILTLV